MPRLSEQTRAQRRQHILSSAWTCFSRDGFHATSMDQVIAETGMSSSAVYRYFDSKEELIRASAEEAVPASPMTRISEMTLLFCANAGATVQKSTARAPNPLSVSLRRISGRMFLSCWIWELMLRRMTGKIGTPSLQPKSIFRSFCWKADSIATGAKTTNPGPGIGRSATPDLS